MWLIDYYFFDFTMIDSLEKENGSKYIKNKR